MKYQVLAQKYRPQVFDDVIGQEVVARTLRNSVISGRVANAYIFCGSRGVGKTSVARLLSKMLNCEKAPEKRPCNECPSCRGITGGNDIDVLEIDGASNNGVDEIRALRENVKFSPSKSRYKIYIIDEVHMLSQGAFNALLKTLEEPPAHVRFIFATTEPHRVLPTIMSRCQRFDFKRISPGMITERLSDIAKKEGISVEEKALVLIARSSDGSLRDSLVMFDQMLSFSGKKVTAADVTELLGMVQSDSMFGLSNAIIDGDTAQTALTIDDMINSGKDPVAVTNSLISHYRDVMIIKAAGKPTSDMALASDELENLKSEAERLSLDEILYFLQALSHTLTLMKGVILTRAPLEITLIRLARRGTVLSLPAILEKLEKMEDGLGSGDVSSDPEEDSENEGGGISYQQPARRISTAPAPISQDENGDDVTAPDRQYLDASSSSWKAVLNYVKNKKMLVHTILNEAKPLEQSENKFVIGFSKDKSFNKDALETSSNKALVEEALTKVLGRPVNVEFTLMEFLGETPGVTPKEPSAKTQVVKEQMKPIIEQAMDVFGGHIVRDIAGEDE